MNRQLKKFAVPGLRRILGVVALLESLLFAFSHSAAHRLAKVSLTQSTGPTLRETEASATIRMLPGEFNARRPIVYAMAAMACVARSNSNKEALGASHDR